MPSGKKTARRTIKKTPSQRPPEERVIHIIMPYLIGGFALFLALCFLLGKEKLGLLGNISVLYQGLFSFGAYFAPILLFLHAFFYKRDLMAGSYLYKFLFSFFDLVLIGALTAIVQGGEISFGAVNYENGVQLIGGGLFGSTLAKLLQVSVGLFAPVICVVGIAVLTSFMFGTTPSELVRNVYFSLSERFLAGKEERRDRRAEDRARREEEKQKREEERLRLAEARAAKKYELRDEAKKLKKKVKCEAALESGESVTEPSREDLVPDEEVQIRLQEEEIPLPEPPSEIVPLSEIDPEPAPSFDEEVQNIFATAPRTQPILPEEGDAPSEAEADLPFVVDEKTGEVLSDEPAPEEEEPEEKPYVFPPLSLLNMPSSPHAASRTEQEQIAKKLVETLASFGVKTTICGISKGPAVTRYELQPQPGVRVRSIVNLTDDIALALASGGVRIEAPIPGKEAVGIEVPNRERDMVLVRELIDRPEFFEASSPLHCCLGRDVAGKPIYCDLAKMPHILIAGATGMGKSVCLNSLLVSILYHSTPEEVQLILIDPKKVEMAVYNRIPHLIVPVVSDSKKAAGALNWAVIEMEKRFIEMEEVGVRDIKHYNEITKNDPEKRQMSNIVIIIDELADLMMTARDEVETSICRLAQKARAAGMHLVIGTQRPSVDVITGLIKSNVPSRIACTVASQVDSRTIIDIQGAEKLMGKGDMLYAPVGSMKPMRVQGCFVGEKEIEAVCDFIRSQRVAEYDESVSNLIEREAGKVGERKRGGAVFEEVVEEGIGLFADKDPLLEKAIEVAINEKKVATSLLQRRLSVGYARAAKLIDYMEEMNVVGPFAGSKPREVLWTAEYFAEYKMRALEDHPID